MAEAKIVTLKPTRPCPVCGKPSSQPFHPFCSARCKDIDLNRWLSGAYVIPAPLADATDDEASGSDEGEGESRDGET